MNRELLAFRILVAIVAAWLIIATLDSGPMTYDECLNATFMNGGPTCYAEQ